MRPAAPHLAALLWALLVAALLAAPVSSLPGVPSWPGAEILMRGDKLFHAVLFFVMALLLHRSLRTLPGVRRPLLWAVLLAVAYGGLLESVQVAVPGRQAGLGDAAANALGAVVAVWRARPGGRLPDPAVR